jgi:hypothetical protein
VKCDTIRRLSDSSGAFSVMVHCYPCKRTVTMDPRKLLEKVGDMQLVDLAERMKCGQCGEKRYIALWADSEPFA